MVKATHDSFVDRYDRKSCFSGIFRKTTDQLHKKTVTTQLQMISIVPRSFGEATQPCTRVVFIQLNYARKYLDLCCHMLSDFLRGKPLYGTSSFMNIGPSCKDGAFLSRNSGRGASYCCTHRSDGSTFAS